MNTLQNFFVDNLNGFSLDQIPLFLFQLLTAGILAFIFQYLMNKKIGEEIVHYAVLTSIVVALITSVVKLNEPTAILGAAAVLLLLRNNAKSMLETLCLLIVVILGIGCGIGSVVLTGLGALIIYGVVLFMPVKK